MKKVRKRVIGTLITLLIIAGLVWGFLQQAQFGKEPAGERLERIKRSPNFKDGAFRNLSHTPDLKPGVSYWTVMSDFFFAKSKRNIPAGRLPSRKTDLLALPPQKDVIVWFGHSSYFIQLDGKKILVDPVLNGSASPVAFTTRSFPGSDVYTVEDIPPIDYLFISHDHWDHLDYDTVRKLRSKVKKVITGLGTGAHLERWGYDPAMILEKDWYEEVVLDPGFRVVVTPARHFSGRGLRRNKALWVSFAFKTPGMNLFLGGDSGYDKLFSDIGTAYGPFDLAILECGQYHEYWPLIHMMPEEVVQAAGDLKAKRFLPVHWSKFSLALHAWDEPIIRVTRESKRRGVPVLTPLIGEAVALKDSATFTPWWEGLP